MSDKSMKYEEIIYIFCDKKWNIAFFYLFNNGTA